MAGNRSYANATLHADAQAEEDGLSIFAKDSLSLRGVVFPNDLNPFQGTQLEPISIY